MIAGRAGASSSSAPPPIGSCIWIWMIARKRSSAPGLGRERSGQRFLMSCTWRNRRRWSWTLGLPMRNPMTRCWPARLGAQPMSSCRFRFSSRKLLRRSTQPSHNWPPSPARKPSRWFAVSSSRMLTRPQAQAARMTCFSPRAARQFSNVSSSPPMAANRLKIAKLSCSPAPIRRSGFSLSR